MTLTENPQQLKQRATFPKSVQDISLTPAVRSIPQQTAPARILQIIEFLALLVDLLKLSGLDE